MEKTQFVYKRIIQHPAVSKEESIEKGTKASDAWEETVLDSFNVDLVIRSITMDDGRLLLLLDDLHERVQDRMVMGKNGKPRKESYRDTFQSEIYLSKEEAKEFFKLTAINSYD